MINTKSGVFSSQGKRVWRVKRVKRSLRRIFCGRAVTGAELEKVIGSVIVVFLLTRTCLSFLDHVYPYIRRYYTVRRIVSSVVASELRVIMGLLIFSRSDLRAEYSDMVLSVDASLSGFCLTTKHCFDQRLLHSFGCWDERWRFKFLRGSNPRDVLETQDLDCLQDVSTVREVRGPEPLEIVEDFAFPSFSKDFATYSELNELWCSPLTSADPIHLKEAHSLHSAVKHLSRNRKAHGLRTLILLDSMCVCLVVSKGRASNRALKRFCRRIAAEVLSSGLKLHVQTNTSDWKLFDNGLGSATKTGGGADGCRCICSSRPSSRVRC